MGKKSRQKRKIATDAYPVRSTRQVAEQEVNGQLFVSPLCSTYENVFPQVRPLIDELKIVRPYGLSRNGARLPVSRTPELAILESPNNEMGWAEFADLMFAMWLTEKELNIHVWKNGRGNIYGYTILPVGSRQNAGNGEYYFQTTSAEGVIEQISPSEVMTLRYSRSPRNISEGVSPASVVFVWSQVADLLAQYQRAYLENGAVPASVTIIRASTKEKFDAAQKDLEGQLKGAQNRNKTIYLWEQVLNTGQSMTQVEVKPIQGNNSTLAIKEIMAIVHDEINKAYGVSEFILGNDSSAKYDNAELSDRQFTKRRVMPALVSFWSQFQHELDRITGGLGYIINFDLDVPELTDRIKVKAEISQKNVENLTNLISAGSTASAAVKALGLAEEWLDVAYGIYSEKQRQRDMEALNALSSQTTVQTNIEETTSVDKQDIGHHSDKECHCHHTHDIKTDAEITFAKGEEREKAIYDELSKVLENAIAQILGETVTLSEEELAKIKLAILEELIKEAEKGENDAASVINGYLVGGNATEIETILENGGYHVSEDFVQHMEERVELVVSNLDKVAQETARQVLNSSKKEGMTAQEIKKALSDVMPAARAEVIARNETIYAFRAGSLENAKNLAKQYDLKIKKTWMAQPDACDVCKAMNGKTVELLDSFPKDVVTKDGEQVSWEHTKYNDNGEITQAHVNCRCVPTYEVIYD